MRRTLRSRILGFATFVLVLASFAPRVRSQDLAKRLYLTDGSYQLVTKYEVKGERVRYLSAERGEWEELPKSMVDWPATQKYEKDRASGTPPPEAAALEKEIEAERAAEEALSPHVLPGLQLPEEGGVFLLDTYEGNPELVPIEQHGGSVNKNMKGNILRQTINPISSNHQIVEVSGKHATMQSHVAVPALYINIDRTGDQPESETPAEAKPKEPEPLPPQDRFRIVRLEAKGDKRIVGEIKIAVYGKISQDAKFVPTTAQPMTGGWVKLTPTEGLASGEYAVVEMVGKDGMNLYVWDFGVNPNAAANTVAFKPDPSAQSDSIKPIELQKRK